ncbi:MAG: sulfotransferase domain-containing protein [Pseudomonadota bacterium]
MMTNRIQKQGLQLFLKSVNRQTFNPTVIKHNQFDCHIATAKQCGTHWIKYMLSLILCEIYNLPKPNHIIEDNIIGHTKTPPRYDHIPQIAVTHSHPHYLLRLPNVVPVLNLPQYIVMVRDPRDILVSAYEKIKGGQMQKTFNVSEDLSFSEFLQSDIQIKKPVADIWSTIQFMNSWSYILKNHPEHTSLIRYEDLKSDTLKEMKRLCDFMNIEGATKDIIQNAIDQSSRSKMKTKLNPNEINAEKSVNLKARNFKDWYSDDDKLFVNTIFKRYLKNNYSYNLNNWDH